MKEDAIFDKVESYLLGQMPSQEREAFEAQVAADPDLARQVARQRGEHQLMEVLVEDDLRYKMRLWREQGEPLGEDDKLDAVARIQQAVGWALYYLVAIGVLVLFLFHFFEKKDGSPPPPQEALPPKTETPVAVEPTGEEKNETQTQDAPAQSPQKSRKPTRQDCLAIARSFKEEVSFLEGVGKRSGDGAEAFEDALRGLQEKRWKKGVAHLLSIPPADPNYWDAQFYAGLARFEQNDFKAAAPLLARAAGNESYLHSERAGWFLALAFLSDGDAARCGELAGEILKDEEHPFFGKAKALQEKLEQAENAWRQK